MKDIIHHMKLNKWLPAAGHLEVFDSVKGFAKLVLS